jgi:hypothetical protein
VASFTVKIETSRLRDCVSSTASAMTPEHDSLTAKRVRIPVRGATRNLSASLLQPDLSAGATHNGAPRRPCTALPSAPRRRPADTSTWGLRAATRGMRERRPAADEQALTDAIPPRPAGDASLSQLAQ